MHNRSTFSQRTRFRHIFTAFKKSCGRARCPYTSKIKMRKYVYGVPAIHEIIKHRELVNHGLWAFRMRVNRNSRTFRNKLKQLRRNPA